MAAAVRLTPGQRDALARLRAYAGTENRWVPEKNVGAHSTHWHLVRKGLAEVKVTTGPRGGAHYWYRPIPDALRAASWRHVKFPGYESRDYWCDCGCGTRLNLSYGLQRAVVSTVDGTKRGQTWRAVDSEHAARIQERNDRPVFEAVAAIEVEVRP